MKYVVAIFILLILLAGCASAIAPAKPLTPLAVATTAPETSTPPVINNATPTQETPPIVNKVTTFKAAKYTDPTYKFSVEYPKWWTSERHTLKGGVFYAKGAGNDIVHIAVRPATNFTEAATTYLTDLMSAVGTITSPNIDSETTVILADGTKANVVLLSALMGQRKAAITGVLKDGNAIMVCGAIDPNNLDLYKEIGSTLLVGYAPTVTTETSQTVPDDSYVQVTVDGGYYQNPLGTADTSRCFYIINVHNKHSTWSLSDVKLITYGPGTREYVIADLIKPYDTAHFNKPSIPCNYDVTWVWQPPSENQ